MLNWWLDVRNGEPFPDQVAVYSSVFLPHGCHVAFTQGESPATITARGTKKLNFRTRIDCEASVGPGSYTYRLNVLVQPYPGSIPQIFRTLNGVIEVE